MLEVRNAATYLGNVIAPGSRRGAGGLLHVAYDTALERIEMRPDREQHVVHVVAEAGGKRPEHRQAIRLAKTHLDLSSLRDVADNQSPKAPRHHGAHRALDRKSRAIAANGLGLAQKTLAVGDPRGVAMRGLHRRSIAKFGDKARQRKSSQRMHRVTELPLRRAICRHDHSISIDRENRVEGPVEHRLHARDGCVCASRDPVALEGERHAPDQAGRRSTGRFVRHPIAGEEEVGDADHLACAAQHGKRRDRGCTRAPERLKQERSIEIRTITEPDAVSTRVAKLFRPLGSDAEKRPRDALVHAMGDDDGLPELARRMQLGDRTARTEIPAADVDRDAQILLVA